MPKLKQMTMAEFAEKFQLRDMTINNKCLPALDNNLRGFSIRVASPGNEVVDYFYLDLHGVIYQCPKSFPRGTMRKYKGLTITDIKKRFDASEVYADFYKKKEDVKEEVKVEP